MSDSHVDPLAPLRPWIAAAAVKLGRDPAKWVGFEFHAEDGGGGISVTGRVGKYGRPQTVFVTVSEADNAR